jgi:hypothetical protein
MKHDDKDKKAKAEKPARAGDVLGISDAPPEVEIPRATTDRGGHPRGIEVRGERPRHWGDDELQPTKGATGIDMGAGGHGTDIEAEHPRPKVSEEI